MQNRGIVIIGAGLTGLSTAHNLKKKGHDVVIVEKESRIGGQIRTYQEDGFVFESGPNTGVVSFPEVVELFNDLAGDCELEIARESSKRRLIWKGNQFHALPSGPLSAITTPLFRLSDKFRILGEPWRKRGTDPDEPVGALAQRRLGKSFYEYAVDPFVSGVYAGDPMKLTTRYALPKLYNLEANYGSFIRGAMAKAKEPKTDRDRLATKKVFSAVGGLSQMVDAMAKGLDIILDANNVKIRPADGGEWSVTFNGSEEIRCQRVVTTVGSYALPALLPFIPAERLKPFTQLFYAPIIQVCVGIRDAQGFGLPRFWWSGTQQGTETCAWNPLPVIMLRRPCARGRSTLLILHRRCPSYRLFAEERRRDSSDRIGSLPLDAEISVRCTTRLHPDLPSPTCHSPVLERQWRTVQTDRGTTKPIQGTGVGW